MLQFKSKVLDYFCANSNFNRLNGSKEQSPKLLIKGIQVDNILPKRQPFSKLMRSVVSFKMSPITSKTKIAYDVKGFNSSLNIINSKPLSLRISICCSLVVMAWIDIPGRP